jgi:apolipoprotein N-acyltransferase
MSMAPNICFESTVPHLIRWQIASLKRSGQSPDLLVNVTNDGWFKGSSILDFHLACAVFRAVENRLPALIAANTGFSAFVDGDGRIVQRGPRRSEAVIYAEVRQDGRQSWYQRLGDLPAGACLLFCVVSAVFGILERLRRPKGSKRTE